VLAVAAFKRDRQTEGDRGTETERECEIETKNCETFFAMRACSGRIVSRVQRVGLVLRSQLHRDLTFGTQSPAIARNSTLRNRTLTITASLSPPLCNNILSLRFE